RERTPVAIDASPFLRQAGLEIAPGREAREFVGDGDRPVAERMERGGQRSQESADLALARVVDGFRTLQDQMGDEAVPRIERKPQAPGARPPGKEVPRRERSVG